MIPRRLAYVTLLPGASVACGLGAPESATVRFEPLLDGWVLWAHLAEPGCGSSLYAVAVMPHAPAPVAGPAGMVYPLRGLGGSAWRVGPGVVVGGVAIGEVELVGVPARPTWLGASRYTPPVAR